MKLEVRGVKIILSGKEILKDVEIKVNTGELVALLGPNGSGKSTLLRTIFGILKPSGGVVLLDGKNLSLEDKAKVLGYLPQETPDVGLRVIDLVVLGRVLTRSKIRPNSKDIEAAIKALKSVNMHGYEDRRFRELSGGEKQKVLLARLFAQTPKMMLLDEPTAHLDISSQIEIMDLIKRKVREGCSAIVAIHDINLAATYADKIIMIKDGKVIEAGSPREVLTPKTIKDVYNIDVIVKNHGRYLYILPIHRRDDKKFRIHIICGGGSGRNLIYNLSNEFNISIGVVNALDSDWEAAIETQCEIIDEVPFSEISEESFSRNIKAIENSDLVILANLTIGKGNIKNLLAAKRAAELKKLLVIDSTPFDERNFAGKVAKEIFNDVKRNSIVIKKEEEVGNVIRRLLDRR